MYRFLLIFVTTLLFAVPLSAQRPDAAMLGAMFQGKQPPPGAVTVLGRAFMNQVQDGYANTIALIVAADDANAQKELGLTAEEINKLKAAKVQMMAAVIMEAPKYSNRLKNMSPDEQKSVQADLEKEMSRITEHLERFAPPDKKDRIQKLVFQHLGGLENPLVNPAMLNTFNLTAEQKQKTQAVFDEMKEERKNQMEELFKIREKMTALGPNITPQEREKLDAERRALEERGFATSKRLAERLRAILTPEQRAAEKQLIASRPSFLPQLPRQMRETASSRSEYVPGADSWRPGQPVPDNKDRSDEIKRRKQFPVKE
ncbi:MAG: hypothetical protein LBT89_04775 [Planctomycetaceae bacterium]|jgi:Spy/CpxP family protein refolding chaperone|nr:hypothetical protein [Planctomycetaceae bacterium]